MTKVETNTFQPLTVPRDADGFVQSFDINNNEQTEIEKARAFFDQYGFVVFSNVYTPEECAATIDDIWNVIESSARQPLRQNDQLWQNKFVQSSRFSFSSFEFLVFEVFGGEQVL
jgi:hypothetical protein